MAAPTRLKSWLAQRMSTPNHVGAMVTYNGRRAMSCYRLRWRSTTGFGRRIWCGEYPLWIEQSRLISWTGRSPTRLRAAPPCTTAAVAVGQEASGSRSCRSSQQRPAAPRLHPGWRTV